MRGSLMRILVLLAYAAAGWAVVVLLWLAIGWLF